MSETLGDFVQKVGATSIAEIDRLISDLQAARSYLKAEGDRIQQEMTRYAHLSQALVSPQGQFVDQGDLIGLMGRTGSATGVLCSGRNIISI